MNKGVQTKPVSRIEVDINDIRRINWFGFKPLLARLLSARIINPAVCALAKFMLPPAVAQRMPLNKASVTYRLENGSSVVLLEALHDAVARDIWHGRGKPTQPAERHKLLVFEQIATSSNTCLDIGAYAGFFALVAARANPRLRSIAFEIVPENYLLIERNVIANDLVDRVEPRLRGLAALTGSMKIPRTFGVVSHLSSVSIGSHFEDGITIPLSRLDDEAPKVVGPVLIKIDVEGFETDIFRGGEEFFRLHKPDVICEILPGAGDSCELISEMLLPLGYEFYRFEDRGLQHSQLEAQPMMRDWLFTTKPHFTQLALDG
jgi:FkbM family methyltransferase